MRFMYELMQEKGKMSKESAAFLTVALMLSMVSLLTAIVISMIGLWGYADLGAILKASYGKEKRIHYDRCSHTWILFLVQSRTEM